MKSIKNTRKGMTLAEIMVGIALVAVMIALVVSFVFMMTERSRVNQANDAILGDVRKVEALVEGWIDTMTRDVLTKEGAAFGNVAYVTGDNTYRFIRATYEVDGIDGKERISYSLKFDNGVLIGQLPDEKEMSVRTESVDKVHFIFKGGENDSKEYIVFCTVTCTNEETGKPFEYKFTVNSRMGEIYRTGLEEETSTVESSSYEPEPTPETES